MKEFFQAIIVGFTACGVVASLVAAFAPVRVLIWCQNARARVLWKILGMGAFYGWPWLGMILGEGIGNGKFNEGFGIAFAVCIGALILTSASRGEQVARLTGKIEERRGKLQYVEEKPFKPRFPGS